ncbi:histamine H3 receptor-like [Paramacrobiotus metropolitanus]|uniref:histamine H3 receptor-like n=1 Tax=Paramacrobiotus metropolitanus TaxID=2943436 RepID=UPI002445A4AA|nr:histamine H3 receptor-like [Paramacrobiotus metropolitanus]
MANETGFNNSNATSGNDTVPAGLSPGTYGLVISVTMICVGTIVYNILIIIAFIRDSAVRNPFSYYILNVSITDLALALFSMTGFVWFTLSPTSNASYCPYYNFFDNFFSTSTAHSVMLISLDRLFSMRYGTTK